MVHLYPSMELLNWADEKVLPYHLYQTTTLIFPFVKYEEYLLDLNDYLFYQQQFFKKRKNSLYRRYQQVLKGPIYSQEELMPFEEEYLSWKYLTEVVRVENSIVLLLAFLEGSLREIYEWFLSEKKETPRIKEAFLSNIQYYLQEIGRVCEYPLENTLKKELLMVKRARKIRNLFVHEWDAYYHEEKRQLLENLSLSFDFSIFIDCIATILEECEKAGVAGEILPFA